MKKAHLIAVTSVKEGWGLIVTEAAAQGTPAVVYDVDGLRDSVKNEITGLVTTCSPHELGDGIIRLLTNEGFYGQCRQAAWEWSKELTFDNTYEDFCKVLNIS
jgi:glycosyltransferase involved in cell wall biosynthesis